MGRRVQHGIFIESGMMWWDLRGRGRCQWTPDQFDVEQMGGERRRRDVGVWVGNLRLWVSL